MASFIAFSGIKISPNSLSLNKKPNPLLLTSSLPIYTPYLSGKTSLPFLISKSFPSSINSLTSLVSSTFSISESFHKFETSSIFKGLYWGLIIISNIFSLCMFSSSYYFRLYIYYTVLILL